MYHNKRMKTYGECIRRTIIGMFGDDILVRENKREAKHNTHILRLNNTKSFLC